MAYITLSYTHVVQTRYFFAAPSEEQRAICRAARVHLYFDDTDGLVVTLTTDAGRLVGVCTWSQERQSGVGADNTVRNWIHIDAMEGAEGDFFDLKTVKTVPSDGDYHYRGALCQVELVDREPEFADGTAALTGATTFVVERDATPEVDAYA